MALEMIEGEQAVGEEERGVRQRGVVRALAAAVGLELVAEVADEAAVEVERQPRIGQAQAAHLALEVVEERAGHGFRLPPPLDPDLAAARLAGDRRPERPAAVAHEGEAGAVVDPAAVEPEGRVGVGEQGREGALGVVEPVEPAQLQLEAGRGRPGGRRAVGLGSLRKLARPRRRRRRAPGAEVAEVGQQQAAVLAADRLRVELDPPLRPGAVRERHQNAVVAPGERLELRRQRLLDAERVVADHLEPIRDAAEQRRALVADRAEPPVPRRRRPDDGAAVHPGQPLVAEADAEQRQRAAGDRLGADAEVPLDLGPPRARRDDDVLEVQPGQLVPAGLVVADHQRLDSVHLGQQLEEVVGERVVVVDQQRPHVL